MNAARRDYKRAVAENAPASVIEELKGDAMGCEEDFRMEFAACAALEELGAMDAAPVAPVKASRVRCNHYKAIRRAFAIAKDAGLDVSKAGKARARHAMEDVVGQCVNSRSEYSGADWMRFGDAVKSGAVSW
jgi:hypothetical protein